MSSGGTAPPPSQIFDVVPHALAINRPVQEQQPSDEGAELVFPLWAPGDAGVMDAGPMQGEVIAVEREHDPILRGRMALYTPEPAE
jgi:hypothetical protein